eukprot:GHVO01025675.1.p1 GENE.GHVO01025675.1~~GHVO01025675.1.p1  ORF type:complete len:160 (+),score=1.19 GHVO01025675.1:58-480(+)
MPITKFFTPSSSTHLSDIEDNQNSPALSSSSTDFSFPPFTSVFPYLPEIRVPPSLMPSETPLRERRGFLEFITITPRPELSVQASAPMPAKGQLEPRAGALPRRRRASSNVKPVIIQTIICESRNFDFASSSDSSDDEEG